MNRKERGKQLTETIDQAVADLERQLEAGHTQDYLRLLDFYDEHFHSYSLLNTLLILLQRPTATRCAGYTQWQKLGCQVRQGEKGIHIRAPWILKRPDPETGELKEKLIGYLGVVTFDISQVDGTENLPSLRKPLAGDWTAIYQHLLTGAARHGLSVEERDDLGVHNPGQATDDGRIRIRRQMDDGNKCLTLIHEITHQLLHFKTEEDRQTSLRQGEIESESASYLVARALGLDNPYARDYILSYSGTVEGLQASLRRIQTAVRTILGWIPDEASQGDQAA